MKKRKKSKKEGPSIVIQDLFEERSSEDLPGYSTPEVLMRVGVSAGTLSQWKNAGLVCPSIQSSEKQGQPARWSEEDVNEILKIRDFYNQLRILALSDNLISLLRLMRTATSDQLCVLTLDGPRLVDKHDTLNALLKITREPCIVIPKV